MTKTCTKCGETKSLAEFHNRASSKDGKKHACKDCSNSSCRKWRESNPEHTKDYGSRYRKENRDEVIARTRRWRENNAEYCASYDKKYREENRESRILAMRSWYQKNAEHAKRYAKDWRRANPKRAHEKKKAWTINNKERHLRNRRQWWHENRHRINCSRNERRKDNQVQSRQYQRNWYHKSKYREDLKAAKSYRAILYRVLRKTGADKNNSTRAILGYTANNLRRHIERQFQKGMSWKNHGEWHIDHIISVAEHIRSGENNPAVINCLTNLRPIWAKENRSKGDKRMHLL